MKKTLLLLVSISLCISSAYAGDIDVKTVKGTSLAELSDAFEILRRFSSVAFSNGTFNIAGKGPAVVFVDGRRLARHTDLSMVPASTVEKIEVCSDSRPEYGNNDGVILVTLIKAEEDEFHLTEVAEMTASPYFGGSSDLEISGRKNSLFYEGGLVVYYQGTRDLESRTSDSYEQKPDKSGIWLDNRKVEDFGDVNRDLSAAAKASVGWLVSPDHLLGAHYEYNYLKQSGDWADLNAAVYSRKDGVIDLVNPSSRYPATSVTNSDRHMHKLNLFYQGEVDDWKISADIDLFAGIKTGRDTDCDLPEGRKICTLDKESRYLAEEGYSRFNASHPLWKGDISFGLSFENYVQNTGSNDNCTKNSRIDNDVFFFMPGTFVTLKQDFGFLGLDFGLHYQYCYTRYTPREDDSTRGRVIEMMGSPDIVYKDWLLHPHLTISAPVAEGKLSAGVQMTSDFPQYSSMKIKIDKLKKGDISEAFTFPCRKDEFFLKGEWEWLKVKGWATHNVNPIQANIDGAEFNVPGYWAMDWRLTISPSVGIWETDLTATVHKQWLNMETVDSGNDLRTPLGTVNWINSFSLPWGMKIDLTSLLRTKGADGNICFRNVFCKADLSIRQPFLNDRLILTLSADNLLRTRQKLSYCTPVSDMDFCWNDRLDYRMFRLSVKFTL